MEELAMRIGAPHRLVHLATIHGHDAFLTDSESINPILAEALGGKAPG